MPAAFATLGRVHLLYCCDVSDGSRWIMSDVILMGQRHDWRPAIEQHLMVIKRWIEYVQDRKIGFKPIVSLVLPKGSKQRVEGLAWLSGSD